MNNVNNYSGNNIYYDYITNEGQALHVINRSPIPGYRNKVVVYNATRSLIEEISNSIFGKKFIIEFDSHSDKEDAKNKEKAIKKIFNDSDFYNEARRALYNQLIGGITAVLMLYDDVAQEVYIKTLDSRTIKNYKKDFRGRLIDIKFESTIDDGNSSLISETKQHLHFTLENGQCYYEAWRTNGYDVNKQFTTRKVSIGLNKIPVWLIENDIKDSYVKKTFYLQNRLNQLFTDNASSLENGQFEQVVLIDVLPRINENNNHFKEKVNGAILNTPGSVIDVYSDDSNPDAKPSVSSISKGFQWTENFKIYTQELIRAIYREYGLTWDDQVKKEPSAKAIKFQKQDLIIKCDSIFSNWEVALNDLMKTTIQYILNNNVLSEKYNIGKDDIDSLEILTNYKFNMLEDEETQKAVDMLSVDRGLMSRKQYMIKWDIVFDEETYLKEFELISNEMMTLGTKPSNTNPTF